MTKQRYTGATEATRNMVLERANYRCELCNKSFIGVGMSIHHRKPRQMGGTKNPKINNASNLLAVCGSGTSGCHGKIESNREEAYKNGHLVHSYEDPAEVPVFVYITPNMTQRVFLTDEGLYAPNLG